MNILALGSHPDDVEFLCAGTLLKYKQQGHKIFIALTTSGNIGSNLIEGREEIARIREAEQLEAAKLYEAEVRFLRYDDEGLVDSQQVRRNILNAIRWANPEVIFTNPPCDRSTDHNMTGTLVGRVMLSLPGKHDSTRCQVSTRLPRSRQRVATECIPMSLESLFKTP